MRLREALRSNQMVWIVIAAGFVLRIAIVLLFYFTPNLGLSDARYYVTVALDPMRLVYAPDRSVVAIGPVYPIFLMPFFLILPPHSVLAQVLWVRLAQAMLDTLTLAVIYLMARRLFDERTARLALVAQAIDPRYLMQVGELVTETLFITVMVVFMLSYLVAAQQKMSARYAGAGVLLGAAVLTRPVPLLYPAVLAVHAWFHPERRREAVKHVGWLIVAMVMVLTPWMVRVWINTGSPMPISGTGIAHFWQRSRADAEDLGGDSLEEAAVEDVSENGGRDVEGIAEIGQTDYLTAALENIVGAPAAWLSRIITDLAKAYIQPYGTNLLPPSPRTFGSVLREVASGQESLTALINFPGLFGRILMYLWHYWSVGFGAAGAVLAWRHHRWESFPLVGWIIYNSALLSLMLVEPRYLFPLMFAFTIFAAYGTVMLWDAVKTMRPVRLVAAGDQA